MLGTTLATAATTGLLSSLHCTAMCGPLAVAGCTSGSFVDRRATAGYLTGRMVSYATVGAVMGHLGKHALCILPMVWVESAALIAVAAWAASRGVALLRRPPSGPNAVLRIDRPRGGDAAAARAGRKRSAARAFRAAVSAWLASLLPRKGAALGLATGFLPCGVLASAWVLAASTLTPTGGAASMAVFCVASTPGLLAALLGRAAARRLAERIPRVAQGAAWLSLAVWVAARPLMAGARSCHLLFAG